MSEYICVDVEANGPAPGIYSMISLGAVILDHELKRTFYGEFKPINNNYIPDAVAVSGFTHEDTLKFPDPQIAIEKFDKWLKDNVKGKPYFMSDNNGFDWQFTNYYFWKFLGRNPFGHSSTNIGSLFKGMEMNMFKNFKHLRKTRHTHNPVDDAKGNCEALLEMRKMGLRIDIK